MPGTPPPPSSSPPSGPFTRLRALVRNDQLIVTALALVVGAVVGGAVIGFREGILLVQDWGLGTHDERLLPGLAMDQIWRLVAVPTLAGLVVGLIIWRFMPGGRPQGVADVIEASALRGGRMSLGTGLKAGLVSMLSIGAGASVGREGPAVHLGASLAAWCAKRLHLSRSLARALLGCGVAAAVAASFNAPIAGALFASEVVLGHYALTAFAPIVIASVTATALSRLAYGDFPAFALIQGSSVGLWELTIFVGLAILAGLVARLFMMSIMVTTRLAERVKIPVWSKPALAGLMVGCIGLVFPQVLGVGYGTTEAALEGQFPLYLLVVLCLVKILATSISLGFGFAGGVFSPALVIGAMLGGAYGLFVDTALPWLGASPAAYTLVGMAAVAAAVLGAPISTALIIFEMTGDFALTLVVMVAVVVASIITRQFHGGSFFHWQLESRGLDLREGFETTLLRQKTVEDLQVVDFRTVAETAGLAEIRRQLLRAPEGQLYVVNGEGRLTGILTLADLAEAAFDPALDAQVQAKDAMRKGPIVLFPFDTLERALRTFRESGETQLAVVAGKEDHSLVGIVHEGSLLEAYNQALVLVRKEERG